MGNNEEFAVCSPRLGDDLARFKSLRQGDEQGFRLRQICRAQNAGGIAGDRLDVARLKPVDDIVLLVDDEQRDPRL